MLVALDRPDVYLSGDLALRRTIQRAYAFDHLPTDQELVEASRTAGGRTGAWPSATCSHRNMGDSNERDYARHRAAPGIEQADHPPGEQDAWSGQGWNCSAMPVTRLGVVP